LNALLFAWLFGPGTALAMAWLFALELAGAAATNETVVAQSTKSIAEAEVTCMVAVGLKYRETKRGENENCCKDVMM
jgi:hypothetical protein